MSTLVFSWFLLALSTPQEHRIRTGDRVIMIGDSHVNGLAGELTRSAVRDGVRFFYEGKNGTTVRQWVRNPGWLAALDLHHPTHVVVVLGTNDAVYARPHAAWRYYPALVDKLRKRNLRIIWVTPPPLDVLPRLFLVRDMIHDLPVETYPSGAQRIKLRRDGIHATIHGYRSWASSIWSFLRTE